MLIDSLICIGFGLAFLLVGFVGLYLQKQFFERAIKIVGQVTDYEESENREGKPMYRSVVSYEFNGETRTIVSALRTPWKPKIGAPCQVGVDPINPQHARIYSKTSFLFFWLFIGFGVAFLLLGIMG